MDTKFHENFKFPVDKLYEAFEILSAQGPDAYRRYCNRVDMPMADRERVSNKHFYETNKKFKTKIDKILAEIKRKCGISFKI
jgi:hypothetical protein